MAGITITGLGSSLDIESIIEGLMKAESAPKARMELQQGQVKARETALQGILTKLQSLSGALEALRSPELWDDTQTVRSSAPESVSAQRTGGAGPGGYQVEVNQLARAEQRTYAFTQSAEASQLTVGGETIELAANATLADAITAINAKPETGVYAVEVGGRLVLSSRQTGAANTISASGTALSEEAAKRKPGLDALFTVDGVAGSSASNTVSEAIPGLSLTLGAVTAAPVTINVGEPGPNSEAIKSQVKAFVSAYNTAVEAIQTAVSEEPVSNPGSQAEANRGVLFGDTGLNSLLSQMREIVSESGLATLGVSTGAPGAAVSATSNSVLGRLSFEEGKLAEALETNPAGTRAILSGASGLTATLGGALNTAAGPGGGISERISAAAAEAARIQESMTQLNERLAMREERLRAQFVAMETALSKAKSESEWLQSQLAGLPQQ